MPADEAVGLPHNEWLAGFAPDGRQVRLEDLLATATRRARGPPRSTFTVHLPLARRPDGGDDPAPGGRDRAEDTQPPPALARPAPDPLCRCS